MSDERALELQQHDQRGRYTDRLGDGAGGEPGNRYLGGIVPFGYRVSGEPGDNRTLVEEPSEQRIIKRARRLRTAGRTLRQIQAAIKKHYDHQISLDALATITRDIAAPVHTAQATVVVQRVKADAAA